MGTIVMGDIVDRARRTLLELTVGEDSASDTRWDRTRELLPLGNAAQRVIFLAKPSACAVNDSFQLATGAKQTLPDGHRLGDVQHNLGDDGETIGPAISIIDRTSLTRLDPSWMTRTGDAVKQYVHDERDPETFYVYPRPAGSWYVNIMKFAPPDAVAIGSAINVSDAYDSVIHDFIVGYALLKNAMAGDVTKADYHLRRVEMALGTSLERSVQFDPLGQQAQAQAADDLGKP